MRHNAVGWLMLAAGTLYLVAAAIGSLLYLRLDSGDIGAGSRFLALIYTNVWMPAVAICLPVAVQLFPTGRPINRFWRIYLVVTVLGGLCVTGNWVLGTELLDGMGLADDSLLFPNRPEVLTAVLSFGSVVGVVAIAGSLLAPLFRLVRRPGEERLQVLWLMWAALLALALNVPSAFLTSPPPVPLLTIPLIPLAMTAAVLKYRLYGITLVINRTVVYLALTAALLAGYFGVVYVLSQLVATAGVRQVLATGVVAVAFAPLRSLLQRLVDRLMFGSGSDPYGALAELGRRLQSPMTPDQVLPAVASTVADALKLPYVLGAGRPARDATRPDGRAGHAHPDDGGVPAHPPRRGGRRSGRRGARSAGSADRGATCCRTSSSRRARPCTPSSSPRSCRRPGSGPSPHSRRSASASAATCTTGSGPR